MRKELIYILALVLTVIALPVLVWFICPVSSEFTQSLVIELIGAGVITLLVSIVILLVQNQFAETLDNVRVRNESKYFLDMILSPRLKAIMKQNPTPWVLNENENERFYLHDTLVNPIYDFICKNLDGIEQANKILVHPFPSMLIGFKDLVDDAFIELRSIDLALKNKVRTFNKNRNAISANDGPLFVYCRTKLFSGLSDQKILEYIEFGSQEIRDEFLATIDESTRSTWKQSVEKWRSSLKGAQYKLGHRPEHLD